MKVDSYLSESKPDYTFFAPAGIDLDTYTGEVAQAIQILKPLVPDQRDVEFSLVVDAEVLESLVDQLGRSGAALMKYEYRYVVVEKAEDAGDVGDAEDEQAARNERVE
ncbi:MAG: hypothetical protein V7642_756 [Burkholderiales bacterium]|jgi:hypothetical protein